MEVSVARYLRTPPEGANPQGLIRDYRAALRSETCLSIVVVGNYKFGPITVATMPGQSPIFTPSSILFRPHQQPQFALRFLVEAPGTAPGSEWFIASAVYVHSQAS